MGIFATVADSKPTVGGKYFLPGNYLVEIQRCKEGETRKKIPFFVVECKIIQSDNPDMKVGTDCSWLVMMDKDAAPGNIKAFVMAAAGVEEDEVDEAGCEEICSERQPLAGTKMRVEAYNKPTKAGMPFTRLNWELVEDASEAA